MGDTTIEWATKVWNFVRGCRRVSPGCGGATGQGGCYAEAIAGRFSGPGLPYEGLATIGKNGARWTGVGRFVPEKLLEPLSWRPPKDGSRHRVFVNSMSDLFFEEFSNEEIAAGFGVMAACPHHDFLILTKRAKRMREWFEWVDKASLECNDGRGMTPAAFCFALAQREAGWSDKLSVSMAVEAALAMAWPLPQVWMGVSAENQEMWDERVAELRQTPAAVRFVSVEPQLGPVVAGKHDLGQGSECPECGWMVRVDEDACCASCGADAMWYGVDWVITGGESGLNARPFELVWARSMRDQCKEAGAAWFMKQTGACPRVEPGTQFPGAKTKMHVAGLRETLAYRFADKHGGDMAEWPEDIRIREFPEVRGG